MDSLPKEFNYDRATKILEVEFEDGSVIRYFDIDPRSVFLQGTNSRRNHDFIKFVEMSDGRHAGYPRIRSEVIQAGTKKVSQPQTQPSLAYEQNGVTAQNRVPGWLR